MCVRICVCVSLFQINSPKTTHTQNTHKKTQKKKQKKAESEHTHWSLLSRFVLANEVLDAADAAGAPGMAFVLTWLRLSSAKLLDWSRRSNYQSKDIAWTQKVISERMAAKAATAAEPWCRLYARLALAGLPRGGGNGDDIRHGILNVMRENGIREGHRPGLDEPFLEQWHQKLHQNTTPGMCFLLSVVRVLSCVVCCVCRARGARRFGLVCAFAFFPC